MQLQGKTIVVTGASSGIGAEVARVARFAGARVVGMDRNDPSLTLDGFVKADLSSAATIDAAVAQLPERFDALCNIAGVPGTAPAGLVADVNYLGLRHLTEQALPRIARGGAIVNVASILVPSGRSDWRPTKRWPKPEASRPAPSGCATIPCLSRPATSTSRRR